MNPEISYIVTRMILAVTGGLVEYVIVFLESQSSRMSECSSCHLIWSIVEP